MSSIRIVNAIKKFGEHTVIPGLSLDIAEGELFTLLGPSGCGKTTLLRMIAGFNSIEGGDFYFDKLHINDIEPRKRNIGMVFQNYAIFPHLTVEGNVRFGLKNRTRDKTFIKNETEKILKTIQIYEYRNKMPEILSGGQQQRVALARALVIKPDVLLMDEPLSNLDAKLRIELRKVIRDIQRRVGITTVYVTHDQEEAMAISDRIAVMNDGKIQHVGFPQDIYHRPKNLFVATFIGRTNIFDGEIQSMPDGKKKLLLENNYAMEMKSLNYINCEHVKVSVRPEDFIICESDEEGFCGTVLDSIYLGLNIHYTVELENGIKVEIIKESDLMDHIKHGEKVMLSIKKHKINIFSQNGEVNLLRGNIDEK